MFKNDIIARELKMITMEHIETIKRNQVDAPSYFKMLDIFEGNLVKYVEHSMSQELSAESFKVASTRIPGINILRRIVKKLSNVYSDVPKRLVIDLQDQEIVDELTQTLELQNKMSNGEDILNLNKCFAIEPFIEEGLMQIRILSPHEFTVLSDDINNPLKVTHFVKYMGSEQVEDSPNRFHTAAIYWIYTKDEFIIVNSDGKILKVDQNPYGEIPIIYVNASSNFLIPSPDIDSSANAILIPKLLADLNYATQFQSHSIMYGVDLEIQKASGAPDSFWNLSSREGERSSPQVGVLSPSVDTEKVLALISFTISQWLESRGVKAGTIGKADSTASGISKIVDESNTSQVVQENRLILKHAEARLWKLLSNIHNRLVGSEHYTAVRGLSEDLEVSISFPEQKPIVDPIEKRNDLKFKLDNRLISRKAALKQANPDLSDDQLEALQVEIDAESKVQELKVQESKVQALKV